MSPTPSTPLLLDADTEAPPSYRSVTPSGEQEEESQSAPAFSQADIVWILAALWSAVFLGALDGKYLTTLTHLFGLHAHQIQVVSLQHCLAQLAATFTNLTNRHISARLICCLYAALRRFMVSV